jgi:hypothetical protein
LPGRFSTACVTTRSGSVSFQAVHQWLYIEPHVLRFGAGAIKAIQDKRKRWDEGLGYQERELFEAFLGLPAPQRKILREVILTFVQACSTINPTQQD